MSLGFLFTVVIVDFLLVHRLCSVSNYPIGISTSFSPVGFFFCSWLLPPVGRKCLFFIFIFLFLHSLFFCELSPSFHGCGLSRPRLRFPFSPCLGRRGRTRPPARSTPFQQLLFEPPRLERPPIQFLATRLHVRAPPHFTSR